MPRAAPPPLSFRKRLTMACALFVLTTTDNPIELDRCYALGAAACIVKPVDYGAFSTMIFRLGEFLMSAALPGERPPDIPPLGA